MTEFATVERAGPQTLIQDRGRRGQQHLGVSVSGSADARAAGWANYLLQNPASAALLEICLGPFALRFSRSTVFAVTGADCGWQLNGQPLANWSTHTAPEGSVLEGSIARSGLRSYLALAGGILTPPVWGSRATSVGERLGGIDGRPLAEGDRIPYDAVAPRRSTQTPPDYVREYPHQIRLRVVPSNQFTQFAGGERQRFFAGVYRVSPQSDRMGVRLAGEALREVPANLVSEAVSPGVIQVPSNGQPIVLMCDCQTIGGYPKLGHVYRVDLDWLAQVRPGDRVQFVPGNLAEAQAELLQQKRFFGVE
ncbi:5-oxoprolinase subunit C family protein [Microbulbifer hainanensis]|uniref:5-oxoprolinase subunit C family protein n=1 Tax=Microbulbifer hainanensis TaxID=2735675 RepID=UPI0018675A90|nr:biotin-dependent carboxyltransferase family protein [Microbulbifer hainanensis]